MDSNSLMSDEFLLKEFSAVTSNRCEEKYKSNSCNDLHSKNPRKAGCYRNVESKVKQYIAALDRPKLETSKSGGKALKKHTSMPSTDQIILDQPVDRMAALRQEKEFQEFKRRSDFAIEELKSKLDVSISIINDKNLENYELMNKIEKMRMEMDEKIRKATELSRTSSFNPVQMLKKVCTPKKVVPISAYMEDVKLDRLENDEIPILDRENLRKRHIDFNASDGSRQDGTKSQLAEDTKTPSTAAKKTKNKKRKVRKMLSKLICGASCLNSSNYKEL